MPLSEAEKVRRELLVTHGDTPEVRRIIDQAVHFLERAEQARAALAAHGSLVITVKAGVFPHPLVAIERTARLAFLTSLRVLRQRPKRDKIGRPSMGEVVLAGRQQQASSRFFRKYITPVTKPPAG